MLEFQYHIRLVLATERETGSRSQCSAFQSFRFDSLNKMAASEKDQAVLESIFNPLLPLGEVTQTPAQTENDVNEESTEDSKRAKDSEALGVERAEQGDLDGALECFNEACEICPSRSSCFNNRAQLWRLKGTILRTCMLTVYLLIALLR